MAEAYQALYRKWRPQVFADVVGQEHVTRTLMNEVRTGRHSHAYLFTGSRGTGKTTCAKIFAKAVNCEHPVNGDPCNCCETCKGIDAGSILDVVEIDAASNNGVDNIREIRDEANFTPVGGKYRVYIIDEVHMLSTGAFNALLKTLEEPPEHVKFVLHDGSPQASGHHPVPLPAFRLPPYIARGHRRTAHVCREGRKPAADARRREPHRPSGGRRLA